MQESMQGPSKKPRQHNVIVCLRGGRTGREPGGPAGLDTDLGMDDAARATTHATADIGHVARTCI